MKIKDLNGEADTTLTNFLTVSLRQISSQNSVQPCCTDYFIVVAMVIQNYNKQKYKESIKQNTFNKIVNKTKFGL